MANPTVYIETFGCQMNELDTELVVGQLRALGYTFTTSPEHAAVLLYNTCSVRQHAEQKVWSRLGDLRKRKILQPSLVVGVLGCLAERDGEDLIKRMPVVDLLCGPGELDKLPSLLDNAVRTRAAMIDANDTDDGAGPRSAQRRLVSAGQVALQGNTSRRSGTLAAAQDSLEMLDLSRSVSPTDHDGSAYVRITRGCNKFCTYCVVPFTRGAEIHRPPDHIIDECKRLADAGVIEVTLLGQTVNHYRFEHDAAVRVNGVTQPQKGRAYTGGHRRDPFSGEQTTTFADLLYRIHEEVPGIQRLRFVTSYPRDFGDDVLEVIRDCPRICRYLHVPAQSGSNRILKLMNRGYTVEEYLEFLDRARASLHQPHLGRPLTIAGDIIVGFPTETEEDFELTIRLLELARYKNCFIFKYSPRPGTTAYDKIPDDVPEPVKRRRNNELLGVQQRISELTSREYVGRTVSVFVQGLSQLQQKRQHTPQTSGRVAITVNGADMSEPPTLDAPAGAVDSAGACISHAATHTPPAIFAPVTTGPTQLTGRTDGDLIVFFDAPLGVSPPDLIGRILPVAIDEARPLSLHGRLADQLAT